VCTCILQVAGGGSNNNNGSKSQLKQAGGDDGQSGRKIRRDDIIPIALSAVTWSVVFEYVRGPLLVLIHRLTARFRPSHIVNQMNTAQKQPRPFLTQVCVCVVLIAACCQLSGSKQTNTACLACSTASACSGGVCHPVLHISRNHPGMVQNDPDLTARVESSAIRMCTMSSMHFVLKDPTWI
jgi:hypothetical protein